MPFLRQKSKIINSDLKSKQNKANIEKIKKSPILPKAIQENVKQNRIIYDSDWAVSELELIDGAVSLTSSELLPQKAKYNFSFQINCPESYLPFIKTDILTKTNPSQRVIGVDEFNFTSLKNINIQLYNWEGVTQLVGPMGSTTDYYSAPFYLPALPTATPANTGRPAFPQPDSAYWHEFPIGTQYTGGRVNNVGTGFDFDLSPDGTIVNPDTDPSDFYEFFVSLQEYYYPFNFFNITINYAYYITFKAEIFNFPLPFGNVQTYSLPYGTSTDPDEHATPPYYTEQYWSAGQILAFNEYVSLVGYDEAKSVFESYYPNIQITEEGDGPPYSAVEPVTTDTVKNGEQSIIISKLAENQWQYNISGYVLLLSPAITETSWSDPNFPTYEPNGEDLYVRLMASYDTGLRMQ